MVSSELLLVHPEEISNKTMDIKATAINFVLVMCVIKI